MTNWSFHGEEKLENSFGQPQSGKVNGTLRASISKQPPARLPVTWFWPFNKGGEIPDAVGTWKELGGALKRKPCSAL